MTPCYKTVTQELFVRDKSNVVLCLSCQGRGNHAALLIEGCSRQSHGFRQAVN